MTELAELIERLSFVGVTDVEWSAFVNGGPGETLARRFIRSPSTVKQPPLDLLANEEVGLNSRCTAHGSQRHIPMIDLVSKSPIAGLRGPIRRLTAQLGMDAWIFDSGRSHHVYFIGSVDQREWTRFLGRLLLHTPPVDEQQELPVDVRWVGHSLENAFSCLRWTANTGRYLQVPNLVECIASASLDASH